VAVFREEKEGLEGLKKSLTKTRATFPLLLDESPLVTKPYSPEGFHTYVISPAGTVYVDLPGTKMKRPGPDKIMAALKQAKESASESAATN